MTDEKNAETTIESEEGLAETAIASAVIQMSVPDSQKKRKKKLKKNEE